MEKDHEIVCPHCAAVNRLKQGHAADAAKCGKCVQALFQGHPVEAAPAMFDKQIARNAIPVLVDVWAPWCGPCRMMAPAFEEAARVMEPQVRLIKLNSEDHPDVAGRFGIRGIPTMLLFDKGREIARVSGAMTTRQIVDWTRGQLGTLS
ncbi:thioredoxin TrxC [Rhizobium sp. CG5]|uniref:thioredoxin TrxC n=1 Tax=Rhizobium sp. CG5 TaxID=2726076 RepID=UPI0020332C34|nr:thioredoxin TrxC [Rhizobium sp. CG5]MCM2472646.1 thioredoxin TrxC [Rhizobium sp. CG5]